LWRRADELAGGEERGDVGTGGCGSEGARTEDVSDAGGIQVHRQLIREDKIALGGEESSGLTIRGHVPEKDGILASLLVAEMTAARGTSIHEQVMALFKKLGREYWPVRENLHLTEEQKASAIENRRAML